MKLSQFVKVLADRTPEPLRRFFKSIALPAAFIRYLSPRRKTAVEKRAEPPAPSQASLMLRGLTGGFAKATAANLESFQD